MFNFNISIKKLKKLLLSTNKLIESFFDNFNKDKKHNLSKKKKLSYIDNRVALAIGAVIILFFSYFLIPTFFDKNETKAILKNQILNKYGININFNEKIEYGLFPRPYFYTKDLTIFHKKKDLAKSNYTKIYISYKNFFSVNSIKVKDLEFKKTEFRVDSNDAGFFNKLINSNLDKNQISFKKSNLFYLDKNEEILFFSKIKSLKFFYDEKKSNQNMVLNFEIFNVPFKLNVANDKEIKKKIIKLTSKRIRLDLKSIVEKDKMNFKGLLDVLVFNKNTSFDYEIKENSIEFLSNNKKFNGSVTLRPFYLISKLNFNQLNRKKLFDNDSILMSLIDSEVLNNNNLNANFIINFDKIDNNDYINELIFKIFLEEGKILINDSSVKWNDAALIKLNNIQLINNKTEKKLVGEMIFEFNDVDRLYSYYQIKRNYRKRIKNINLDFIFNILENRITFNNLKINENSNQNINELLEKYNIKENNLFNKVTFRNFIKEFFKVYAG